MRLLAVDIGTSSVKAAVFDQAGRELGGASRAYRLEMPRPGWVEVAPEVYWQKTREAVRAALALSGEPAGVRAVGVTSQGETLVTLDNEGRPVRDAMVWLDTRAQREAGEIEAAFGAETIYRITGQGETSAGYTASMIRWLKRHEPENFNRTARFLLVTDYIVYRLTGNFVAHKALYPSTLYYDIRKETWWREMLEFLAVNPQTLPRLVNSGVSAGTVTAPGLDLSPKTIVCAAPIDQVTGTLGAGNFQPGGISECTGTVLALCAVTDTPVFDADRRFCLFPHAVPKKFVAIPWAPSSGSILSWFQREFCPEMTYQQMLSAAASVPPGSEGLNLLPYFEGIGCPDKLPGARGAFWGITLKHQKQHFIRAILEAIAYLIKDYLLLLQENGIGAENIVSLGGAVRSKLWLQIKADVLGKRILTNRSTETVCLGAAMVAAAGTGLFTTCEEAARAMSGRAEYFAPRPERTAVYQELYLRYQRLREISKSFYQPGAD